MHDKKFEEILKQRSAGFKLKPNAGSFNAVMANVSAPQKVGFKTYFVSISAFILVIMLNVAIFFYPVKNKHSKAVIVKVIENSKYKEQYVKNIDISKKIALKTKPQISYIQSKGIENLQMQKTKKHFEVTNMNTPKFDQILTKNTEANKLTNIGFNDLKNEVKFYQVVETNFLSARPLQTKNKFEFGADHIQLKQINQLTLNANRNSLQTAGNKNKTNKMRYSVSAYYQYFIVNNAFNGAKKNIDALDIGLDYNENASKSFSTGLLGSVNINNWIFSTGVGLNKVSFNGLFTIPFSNSSLSNKSLEDFNLAGYQINVIDESMSWIEIPVTVGYKFGNKKWALVPEVGFVFQRLQSTNTFVLTNQNGNIDYYAMDDAKNSRFEVNQQMVTGAVLCQYRLTPKFDLYVGPNFRYHFNSYLKKDFSETKPAFFSGIQGGLRFNF